MELPSLQKELIKRLSPGQFFSGQKLAHELGVSRTSVWNHLKSLEQLGFKLHAVKGKGTRLEQPMELLDKSELTLHSYQPRQGTLSQLTLLDICTSTNDYLSQKNKQTRLVNGTVCLAEMQTAGKGRLGRSWVSPYGQNIYMSFFWRFKNGLSTLAGLSLACGVAVCSALKELGVEGHGLKWPNDILWQGKKLGGILVEIQGESQSEYSAIIGIGINYDMGEKASEGIDQPWVDLANIKEGRVGRNKLAAMVIDKVLGVLEDYESTGLLPYVSDWNAFDCYHGEKVKILSGKTAIQGVAKGISSTGELLLLRPNGQLEGVSSGEVSLRLDKP